MINIFKMNDWPVRKFIILSLSLLISLDGLILLNKFGIEVPLVRQIVGFILLTFIPGYAILRILRVHNLDEVSSLMFSIGLSMSFIMLLGLFLKLLSYYFSYFNPPFKQGTVETVASVMIGLLLSFSYIRDKDYEKKVEIFNVTLNDLQGILFVLIFLSLVIVSTYLATYYNLYVLQRWILILLIFISIYLVEIMIRNKLSEYLKYLLVWLISISLLYHSSLMYVTLWGADINSEFHLAKMTLINANWEISLPDDLNSMASITILPVFYSILLDVPLIYIFKLFYPLIFSLVPVSLYNIYRSRFKEVDSVLSVLLFVFYFGFYTVLPALARQEIAEFYLVLLIMLIISVRRFNLNHINILGTIFLFSLIISHYSTFVFFQALLFGCIVLQILLNNKKIKDLDFETYLFVLGSLMAFIWYLYTSRGALFVAITQSLWTGIEILFKTNMYSAKIVESSTSVSLLKRIELYLNAIIILGGILGTILIMIHEYKKSNISKFVTFSLVSYAILLVSLVSTFGARVGTNRVYNWVLFFISPYAIYGIRYGMMLLINYIRPLKDTFKSSTRVTLGILLVYFLFNSSLIYYYAHDSSKYGLFLIEKDIDFFYLTLGDVYTSGWIDVYYGGYPVTAGHFQVPLLHNALNKVQPIELSSNNECILRKLGVYLFLSRVNILNNVITIRIGAHSLKDENLKNFVFCNRNIIIENTIYMSSIPTKIIWVR